MRIEPRQPGAGAPAPRVRRRGMIVSLEMILWTPLLILLQLFFLQFYLLVTAREEMLNATRTGARVAALVDGRDRATTEQEARQAVQRALGSGRLRHADIRFTWSQDVQQDPVPGEGPWVQVTCEIPTRIVTPDFLGLVGSALGQDRLVAATVMRQE